MARQVDLETDILARMAFQPVVADHLKPMQEACFQP